MIIYSYTYTPNPHNSNIQYLNMYTHTHSHTLAPVHTQNPHKLTNVYRYIPTNMVIRSIHSHICALLKFVWVCFFALLQMYCAKDEFPKSKYADKNLCTSIL